MRLPLKEKEKYNEQIVMINKFHNNLQEAFENTIKKNIIDFKKHFYICGPDAMVKEISDLLKEEGASEETLVFEK